MGDGIGIDCVELKNRIQAEILEERKKIGEEEQESRTLLWLGNSEDPLARWWREVTCSRNASS